QASTVSSADLVQVTASQLPGDVKSRLAEIAKALGDPQRVEILHLLASAAGPVCVLDLEYHLKLAQSTVSHHLKVLVDAGVCGREPRGRWTYYTIHAEVLAHFRHQVEHLVHFPDWLSQELVPVAE
ncbi:MAG: ArsR/SmtB family transcription factor, partial [Acidimicrobiales bacterium]